jgi:uncharacterized surface protein with fasciclin (FAS1) repeats
MRLHRRIATLLAASAAVTGVALAGAPSASATGHQTGTTPLTAVLTADGNTFDRNPYDFDIVTQAALAVLAAKPKSAVGVLADGNTAVTAFIPTDRAFRRLVKSLTGKWVKKESDVFAAVAGLGIDTVETVLLYHVVPGATIDKAAALHADGAVLTTAQGGTITVDVLCHGKGIKLIDNDPDARNPRVKIFDINAGNKQIAHGINRVLRPVDL